jgi:hypothetical protein
MSDVRPRYQLVGLDCPNAVELASFYSQLTGLDVEPLGDLKPEDVEWIELDNGAHPTIAFQKVPNYVAPTWPTGAVPQQLHLDFLVPDLDEGEAHVLSIGARKHEYQPGTTFRVYLDPVGHPFCLVKSND